MSSSSVCERLITTSGGRASGPESAYALRTPLSSLTFRRVVHHFQHRRIDHAQHRFALLNQRDIDREFAIALDELFGAVERIDQPVALPVLAHFLQADLLLKAPEYPA